MSVEKSWKDFLNNQNVEKDIFDYIGSLQEFVGQIRPKTFGEKQQIETAKEYLKEVRKLAKRLETKNDLLEAKINILEHNLSDGEILDG